MFPFILTDVSPNKPFAHLIQSWLSFEDLSDNCNIWIFFGFASISSFDHSQFFFIIQSFMILILCQVVYIKEHWEWSKLYFPTENSTSFILPGYYYGYLSSAHCHWDGSGLVTGLVGFFSTGFNYFWGYNQGFPSIWRSPHTDLFVLYSPATSTLSLRRHAYNLAVIYLFFCRGAFFILQSCPWISLTSLWVLSLSCCSIPVLEGSCSPRERDFPLRLIP